jgi:hypothetical protein
MIAIAAPPQIPLLLRRAEKARNNLCEAYDRGERNLRFLSNVYGARSVKKSLAAIQNFKCCYCETRFLHSSFGDIDHFRPKAAVRQSRTDPESIPGYYWLAYDVANLLFTCEVCNRSYKRTLFPLADPNRRVRDHTSDLASETPLIINPRSVDPTAHIGFRGEYPYPLNGSAFGEATISCLGLDRETLNDARREHLELVRALWIISQLDAAEVPEADVAKEKIVRLCDPEAQFCAATRACVSALQRGTQW